VTSYSASGPDREPIKPSDVTADAQWVDAVVEAERAEPAGTRAFGRFPDNWPSYVPSAVVLVAVAWWLIMATYWWGGRDDPAVTGGAIVTALAVIAIRPHHVLPRAAVLLGLWVSGAALLVAAVAPTGWAGATNAADYVCAAWMVLCVAAAVMRDRWVGHAVLVLLVIGVVSEIRSAWLAWWSSENSASPMTGTFYWHNPFAIYLVPGAVVGLALWLRRTGTAAWLGILGFALGAIGIFYSTSRASLVCFAAAALVVAVAHVVGTGQRGIPRVVTGAAGTAAVVWVVGGPPFFPHRHHSPIAGLVERSGSQSLGQNGGYRLDFWREAFGVFGRHPVTGGGYHSMATASAHHNPHGWPLSPLAHNGFLQALSDGGLLLGVPFLLACAVVSWWVLTGLWSAVGRRDFGVESFVAPLVLGALMVHSAVDFDWSYPADFILAAILVGLVAGQRWSARDRSAVRPSWLMAGAVLAGVALLIMSAVVARSGDLRLNLPITSAQGASQ
jgi:O-antigen ligase